MSVLINMEMPTSCSNCPMLEGDALDGLCHAASRWLDDDVFWTWYVYPEGDVDDSKPCNCPLLPVPKHGRLIDADALIIALETQDYSCAPDTLEEWTPMDMTIAEIEDIRNAPTIIEGEGSE